MGHGMALKAFLPITVLNLRLKENMGLNITLIIENHMEKTNEHDMEPETDWV